MVLQNISFGSLLLFTKAVLEIVKLNLKLDLSLPSVVILFNRNLNRSYLVYVFSLRFSRSEFLTNSRRQFRVRKIFLTQIFAGFVVFSFCV